MGGVTRYMTVIRLLGIETSCDETACAIVELHDEDRLVVCSNVVASQVETHRQYGGVFPEVAARMHVEAISAVVDAAIQQAGVAPDMLDGIAVTNGPGLAGSLLVGVNYAKALSFAWSKPLLGIHHIEGHLYSLWLTPDSSPPQFPSVCLIVSGGHTELWLVRGHGDYQILGATLDDAAGEAFDKVGRVLGLPYPGGPSIQKASASGDATAYDFHRPTLEGTLDFSFSGLKTLVMRAVQNPLPPGKRVRGAEQMNMGNLRPDVNVNDAAASFQAAAVAQLVEKTIRAADQYGAVEILVGGGVSANALLREQLRSASARPVRVPMLQYCMDNAAMIAAAGCFRYRAGERSGFDLDVLPMRPIAQTTSA